MAVQRALNNFILLRNPPTVITMITFQSTFAGTRYEPERDSLHTTKQY